MGLQIWKPKDVGLMLELVLWKPRRSHAYNRHKIMPVIGVTNYDPLSKMYYAMFEVDEKSSGILKQLLSLRPAMVVETMKGYHCYLQYKHPNPLKVLHYCFKLKVADRGQLKLAKKRYESGDTLGARLILRVSPKYVGIKDLKVVYESCLQSWHARVKKLIEALNQ